MVSQLYNSETLEILNIFTRAVRLAQSRNRYELAYEISETTAMELLKQAFPHNRNFINRASILTNILKSNLA